MSKALVLYLFNMGANDYGQHVFNTDPKFCGKAILKKMEEARNHRFSAVPMIPGRGKKI